MADDDGDLQNGFENAHWLHGRLNDIPNAAGRDYKEALSLIQEFNRVVRIIRLIDQNHVSAGYGFRARTL